MCCQCLELSTNCIENETSIQMNTIDNRKGMSPNVTQPIYSKNRKKRPRTSACDQHQPDITGRTPGTRQTRPWLRDPLVAPRSAPPRL